MKSFQHIGDAKSRMTANRWLAVVATTLVLALGLVAQAQAAARWVSNPASCPQSDATNFPGQNCTPQNMCGDSSGIAQCYGTSGISAPVSSVLSTTQWSAAYGGGYLINCYAASDAASPLCDNNGSAWCNSDVSCYGGGNNRQTQCTGGTWASAGAGAFSCGACLTTHLDCGGDTKCEVQKNVTDFTSGTNNHFGTTCNASDARCDTNYYDCDASGVTSGNGCEALRSGACTGAGGIAGTWSCSVNAGGSCSDGGNNYSCVCVTPKCPFESAELCQYFSSDPLLWGLQLGTGNLITMGNSTNDEAFVVHNDGSISIATTTAPGVTDNTLYNIDGDLYWDGVLLGMTSGGASSTLQQVTDNGNTTTNRIQFAGATSTGGINVVSTLGGSAQISLNADDGSGNGGSSYVILNGDGLGGGESAIKMQSNGTTYGQIDAANDSFRVIATNGSNLNFGTQGFGAIFRADTGRLGLGTASPNSTLHVVGTSATSSMSMLTLENTVGGYDTFVTVANPNGEVSGSMGDLAVDVANGRLYMKQMGNGTNTGWFAFATSTGAGGGTLDDAYNFGGAGAGRLIQTADGSMPVEISNPGTDQWENTLLLTNAANGSGVAMQTMNSGGDTGGRMYFVDDTSDPSNSTGGYLEYSNLTSAFEFGYNVAGARQSSFYIDSYQMALQSPGTEQSGALRLSRINYNVPNLTFGAPGLFRPLSFSMGTSTPEGKIFASRGSLYNRVDGTGGTGLVYVKTTDDNKTGWVELLTASSTLPTTSDLQAVTDVGNTTTNPIQFAGGTSTGQFIINGKLGINTDHPYYSADIHSDDAIQTRWSNSSGEGLMIVNDNLGDEIGLSDIRSDGIISAVSKADPNLFYYANRVLNARTDSYRLGVNTTTPVSMLDLEGGAYGEAVLTINSVDGMGFGRDAGIFINTDYANGSDAAFIKLNSNGVQTAKIYSTPIGSGIDVNGNLPYEIWTNARNRINVGGDGHVGISTTTPRALLTVDGNTAEWRLFEASNVNDPEGLGLGVDAFGGDMSLYYNSGNHMLVSTYFGNTGDNYDYVFLGDRRLTVRQNSGFVGIDTMDPQNRLDVNGAISISSSTPATTNQALYNLGGRLYWNGVPISSASSLVDADGDTSVTVETSPDEDTIRMSTAGAERLKIDYNGRIGINVNNPLVAGLQIGHGGHMAASLSINGDPSYTGIAAFRDADGEDIFTALGRLSNGNFEFMIGDASNAYSNSYNGRGAIVLSQAQEAVTFGRQEIRFESSGPNYVGFLAPASVAANTIWTLPAQDGTAGQVLSTDGSGTLSWADGGAVSGEFWSLNGNTNATSGSVLAVGAGNPITIGRMSDYDSWVNINSGSAAPGSDNPGGSFGLNAGYGDGSGNGGSFYMFAGEGGNTTGSGGDVNIGAGSASNDGNGGFMYLNAGSGSTNGYGGNIYLVAGASGDSGPYGGDVVIRGGDSNNNLGGNVNLIPGYSPSNGYGKTVLGYDMNMSRSAGQVFIGTSTRGWFQGALVVRGNDGSAVDLTTSDDPGGITIGSDRWGGEFGLTYNNSNRLMVGTRIGGGSQYDYVDLADRTVTINSVGHPGFNTGFLGINNTDPQYALDVNSGESWNPIASFNNISAGFHLFSTTGTPEGAVIGSMGDIAVDPTNGMAYIKQSGMNTKTGWVRFATNTASGAALTLQQVTDNGNTTNNKIQFAGGTSTGDFTVERASGGTSLNVVSPADDAYLKLIGNAGATDLMMSANGGANWAVIETSSDGSFNLTADGHRVAWADAGTGYLGVGTDNPQSLLNVYSDTQNSEMRVSSGAGQNAYITLDYDRAGGGEGVFSFRENGTQRGYMNSGNNGYNFFGIAADNGAALDMFTRNQVRMHINDLDGHVGIGTTAPSHRLTVDGGSTVADDLFKVMAGSDGGYVSMYMDPSDNRNSVIKVMRDLDIVSEGWGKTLLKLTDYGVGIGTLDPMYDLDVVGDARVSGQLMLGRYAVLPLNGYQKGAMVYSTTTNVPYFWDGSNWVAFATGTGSAAGNAWVQGGNAFGAPGVLGTNDAQPLTFVVDGNEIMRIDASGNIAVGTNSPISSFDIAKDTYNSFMLRNNVGSGESSRIYVDGDVENGGTSDVTIRSSGTDYGNMAVTKPGIATRVFGITSMNGADLAFGVSGVADSMYLDSANGYLGLATTTAAYRLDVVGDVRLSEQLMLGKYAVNPATGHQAGAMIYNTASSTPFFWNGLQWVAFATGTAASGSQNLQQVTDVGNTTNRAIQFAGATSTGNVVPGTTNSLSLGTSANRWSDIWGVNVHIGSSTWDLSQTTDGDLSVAQNGGTEHMRVTQTGVKVIGQLQTRDTIAGLSNPSDVYVQGDYVYVINSGSNTLAIYDASDIGNVVAMDTIATSLNQPMQIVVKGNRAYVMSLAGLSMFNVADPNNIVFEGNYAGFPHTVFDVVGDLALAENSDEILTYDVSDPTNVFQLGTSGARLGTVDVVASGNYAYTLSASDIDVVALDLSDPGNPMYAGIPASFNSNMPVNLVYSDKYVYVLSSDNRLESADFTDPNGPVYVDSISTGLNNPTKLAISGSDIYVVDDDGVALFSTSNGNLSFIQKTALPGGVTPTNVANIGNKVFVLSASSNQMFALESTDGDIEVASNAYVGSRLDVVGDAYFAAQMVLGEYSPSIDGVQVGAMAYSSVSSTPVYWNGSTWVALGGTAQATTLDSAYDAGGSGLGRTITADAGAVHITGTTVGTALQVDMSVGGEAVGVTNSGAGVGMRISQSGAGMGMYVRQNNGQGIVLDNNTANDGMLINNSADGNGLNVNNDGTSGNGIYLSNLTDGAGIYIYDTLGKASFHVEKPSGAGNLIDLANAGSGRGIDLSNSGSGEAVRIANTGSANSIYVSDAATDLTPFVLDASGRVGIGTDSPTAKLQISDNNSLSDVSLVRFQASNNSDIQSEIYFAAGGNSTYWNVNSSGAGGAFIIMDEASEVAKFHGNAITFNEGGSANMDLRVESDTLTHAFFIDATNGYTGFDQSTPAARVHVGNTTAGSLADYNYFRMQATGDVDHSIYLPFGSNMMVWDYNMTGNGGALEFRNYGTRVGLFTNTGLVINDGGVTGIGLRVEGDTNANLIYTDAANDRVGIGTNAPAVRFHVTQSGNIVAAFDRTSSDGTVISIRQDGTEEGTISVSGTTVSYNAFTGSHYAWTDETIETGMLVRLTDKNRRLHGRADSEILYGVQTATSANDPRIMGAYLALQEPTQEAGDSNPHLIAAVGNGDVWVADKGQNVASGDYLISSDIKGHAMKDDGTYPVSYVFARAAEPVDWSTVTSTVDGVKHTKISVFFDSFARINSVSSIQPAASGSLLAGTVYGPSSTELTVSNRTFPGTVTVLDHVELSKDSVGQAMIMTGATRVHVTFDRAYDTLPIVTVTQHGARRMDYGVENVSLSGFDIVIDPIQYRDILFDWHAFGEREAKVFVSNGTTSDIEMTDMGTSKLETQLNATSQPEPAPVVEESAPVVEDSAPVVEEASTDPEVTVEQTPATDSTPVVQEEAPVETIASQPETVTETATSTQ